MLVLTRKVGEVIAIGDSIHLTLLEVCGTKVRLGIAAPKNVTVDRQEVRARRIGHPRAAAEPAAG